MIRGEGAGPLARRRRMPVPGPQTIYDLNPKRGMRNVERNAQAFEEARGAPREPKRAPLARHEAGRDANRDQPRRPAEPCHAQRESGGGAARAKGDDDCIRGLTELRRQLERGEYVPENGARVRAPTRDPAGRAEPP